MSLPITEAVVLTLQSGASPDEALNGLSQIFHRQAGFQRFRWGQWKESSDKLQLLIDWDNLKVHQDFEASGADYAAVGTLLGPILAAAPSMRHVSLSPQLSDGLLIDNVTEIATLYGLAPTFESGIAKFLQVLGRAVGFKGVSGGAVVEELDFETAGKKLKAYMIAITWTSIEDHVKAMATKEVMEVLPLIGGATEHVEMHHVQFRKA